MNCYFIISADDKYIKHFFCYTFFRFPLHNRGKELAKFFYGIFLLNKNIAQVESQFKCLYCANDLQITVILKGGRRAYEHSSIGRTGYAVFLRRNLISVCRNTLTR